MNLIKFLSITCFQVCGLAFISLNDIFMTLSLLKHPLTLCLSHLGHENAFNSNRDIICMNCIKIKLNILY